MYPIALKRSCLVSLTETILMSDYIWLFLHGKSVKFDLFSMQKGGEQFRHFMISDSLVDKSVIFMK